MLNRRRQLLLALATLALCSAPAHLIAQETGEATSGTKEDSTERPAATSGTATGAQKEQAPKTSSKPDAKKSNAPAGDKKADQKKEGSDKKPATTTGAQNAQQAGTPTQPEGDSIDDPSVEEQEPIETDEVEAQEEEEGEAVETDTADTFQAVDESETLTTDTSPIADLAGISDEDFIPLEDIEEEDIDPIFPAQRYPYIDWSGQFRLRHRVATRFDLGTGGSSAILPPTESYTPSGNPANPEANKLWGADMRMRLEPTLSLTEGVRLHIEADLLGNQVLGSLPVNGLPPNPIRPDPSRNQASSAQFSARDQEWYQGAFRVNEAYGELSGFFGSLKAGRMDNHWGLGMFYNNGDCDDCDWGDSIDRVMVQTQFMGIYGSVAADWPGEGITSVNPNSPLGQPYDRTQIDDINQYTFSLLYAPQTELELERQYNELTTQHRPIINAGALFSIRSQEGTFANPFEDPDLSVTGNPLIYRGMNMYVGDAWAQFLYNPKADVMIRLELEFMTILGSVDNATFNQVGQSTDDEMSVDVNCFDEDARNANTGQCGVNSKDFQQFGLAFESEFSVGGPVNFGLNGGFASGGNAPNWGLMSSSQLNGQDLDFYRFDPDYHVDLILFRNVIGTVTNASYINPYLKATFFERGERKLRFDLDGILSRSFNINGTPSARSPWLGMEMDGALRFFLKDVFHASLEGGLLLPFNGLGGTAGRERLTQFGTSAPEFTQDIDPSTAWTVQLKGSWNF